MKLLVDGYNLLHASGVFGQPSDPPTLETARRALLSFLAQHLPERERSRATVVFDGKDAPPGLPERMSYERMSILFSRSKSTADELIAELIAVEKQPRQLFVVSSDHAVQRAARQRGVPHQDSELWIRDLRARAVTAAAPSEKVEEQSAAEVAQWVQVFSPPTATGKRPPPAKIPEPPLIKKKPRDRP